MQHLGNDPKRLNLHVFESALHAADDVIKGSADVAVVSAVSTAKALEAGTLRALAVSSPARMGGLFSGVPTWSEQSVPCVSGLWRGIIGAPDIDEAQIAYWEQVLAAGAAHPDWLRELQQQYWTNTWKASADTRDFLDGERIELGRMLGELGLIA